MPISDEIIELEPVKKSKFKIIIMFAAIGVLLALTVTFLVLFLLKEGGGGSTGAVLSVEESPVNTSSVSGAKPLFNKSGSDEAPEYVATVGVDYTVAVKVSTQGDANALVSWIVEPVGAVEKKEEGSYELGPDGTTEEGKPYVQYLKFSAFPEFAGREVTVTARSQSDSTQRAVIKFTIVDQGAESIEYTTIARNEVGASVSNITTESITLPFYENKLNSYNIGYQQFGAYNGSSYSDIAVVKKPDGSYSNKVSVISSNEQVVTVRLVETAARPMFEINLVSTGTAEITLSANINNDNDVITKKLVIVSESSKTLKFIDDIRVVKEVADAEYFKNLGRTMPSSIPTLTLPYNTTYSNFLTHVVLSPTTLQYDSAEDELIDGWKDNIKVTSSNPDVATVTKSGKEWSITTKSALATGSECVLTVIDESPNSLGVSRQINLRVVAQNRADGITAKVHIDTDYVDSYISKNALDISQGLTATVSITYSVTAPASASADTLNKYISSNYRLVYNKSEMSVSLSGTTLEPYNANPGPNEKSNEYDLSSSLEFARTGTTNTYTATATFVVTISTTTSNGEKSFKFIKIGSELPDSDTINQINATVEKTVRFNVTNIAQKVGLITSDEVGVYKCVDDTETDRTAYEIITAGGEYAGVVREASYEKNSDGVCIGKYNIRVQRQAKDTPLWFAPSKLLYADGPVKLTNVTYTGRENSLRLEPVETGVLERPITFTGSLDEAKKDASQLAVKYEYSNKKGVKIGEITVNIYFLNGVDSIRTESSGAKRVTYKSKDKGLGSFPVDGLIYTYHLASADIGAQTPYDFEIKVGDDASAVELNGTWNGDRTQKDFTYTYTDKTDVEQTINVIQYRNGYFYLQQDLFALGYTENINLSRMTISYSANPEHYPRDGIHPASRVYNFVRVADDIGLYTESDYGDNKKVEKKSNGYTVDVNHLSTLKLYTSPIIDMGDKQHVVVKRPSDQPNPDDGCMLAVENAYLRLPNGLTYTDFGAFDEIKDDTGKGTGAYRYVVAFMSDSPAGKKTFSNGEVRLDSAYIGELTINVLNYMRYIDANGIKIYDTPDSANFDESHEIKELTFGMFNNTSGAEQKVLDRTSKTVYIRVDYAAPSTDQSEFEAATLNLPLGFTASEGGRVGVTGSLELKPASNTEDVQSASFGKTWEVTISLDKATATAGINDGGLNVYNSSSQSAAEKRISASVKTTVVTGIESVTSSLDQKIVTFAFANDVAMTKDIDIGIVSNTAFAGYANIAYDFDNLTCSMKSASGADIAGVSADYAHISDADSPHIVLTVDPKQLAATLTHEPIVFTFIDTVNGTNKKFELRVSVSITMEVWAISQPDGGYTVTTTGADSGEAECALDITYNEGSVIQPSSTALGNIVAEIAVYENGEYKRVENTGLRVADGKVYVLNSKLSSETTQYYVHVYYGIDKTPYSAVPVNIATSALDLALSDAAKANVDELTKTADLKFAASTDSYNLAAAVVNGGNGVGSDSTGITYALYSNSDRTIAIDPAVATIDGNGVFKLIAPESASGIFYYRASYNDSTSGKTRTLDLTINYTVQIKAVTLTGIDAETYKDNVITLYYCGTGYTRLDLAGHIVLSTDFGAVAPTACDIVFNATNADIVNGAIFDGTNMFLTPVKAGESPFTITATDSTGKDAHLDFTLKIVELKAADLSSDAGSVNLIENESVTISPTVGVYNVFDYDFRVTDASASGKFAFAKSGDDVTVSLNRNSFTKETDSDDKPYTLVAISSYTYKTSDMTPVIVGTLAPSTTYTLTVTDDFDFDFDLFNGSDSIADGSSFNVDHTASYALKFPVPSGEWYNAADWTFKAVSSQPNIATLANGGVFDKATGSIAVTPKTTGCGYVTFTVTATAYGTTVEKVKSYTFAVSGNVAVSMSAKAESDAASANLNFVDGVATKAIDFTTTPAKFVYTVELTKVGVTAEDVMIDFVGDVTASAIEKSGDTYTRTFTAEKPTTLIVSSAVKMNGTTFYSEKYTVNITATKPDFTLTGGETVDPASTLRLGIGKATKFKGNYTVTYAVVQSGTGVSVDNSGLVTAPTVNLTDKAVTIRATVTVTSGAYKSDTPYVVEKNITVVGVPLPEISWKDKDTSSPITVLGPSALTAGGASAIDLSKYVNFVSEVYDSYNIKHTYSGTTFAYSVNTNLTSGTDYTLTADGKLGILASPANKAGGLINVTVTATLVGGENAGKTVSATLPVKIMPEAQDTVSTGVYVSGKADTYELGTLAQPVSISRDGSVKPGDKFSVKYTLPSAVSSKYSIFADTIRVINSVTEVETVPVTVDIVITSGAYAGTAITRTVNVTVLGIALNAKTVAWDSSSTVNAYSPVNALSLIDTTKLSGWTVKGINVTTDSTSYSTVENNGGTSAVIKVDKEYNVATSNGAADATMNIYYDITLEKSDSSSVTARCYGAGQLTVNAIEPSISVEIDGTKVTDDLPAKEIPGGQSFIVSYIESKNLTLTGVTVTNCGSYLSYEISGSSIQFSAYSYVSVDQSARTVTVGLSYASRGGNVTITKQISVTVKKAQRSLYDVTNTNVELYYDYNSGSGTTYKVYSVWTATDANTYKYPVRLQLSSSSRLSNFFDTYTRYNYIEVHLFNASGSKVGQQTYDTYQINGSTSSISIDLTSYRSYEVQRLVLVMPFRGDYGGSSTLNATYYTSSSGSTYSNNSAQASYTIRRVSGSVAVTFNANGGTVNGSSSTSQYARIGSTMNAPSSYSISRTGYTFAGWYPMTNPDSTVDRAITSIQGLAKVNAGGSFTVPFNTTYYAAWTAAPTTVTLNGEGGEILVGSSWKTTTTISVYYGKTYSNLPAASSMRRTGYTFVGWYNGSTRVFTTTTVTVTGAHTLSAHWTADDVTVNFNANGGELDTVSMQKTVKFNSAYGDMPTPTYVGHTFVQWEKDGSKVDSTTLCTTAGSVTLTAKWNTISYTVTLNPNYPGGTVDDSHKIAYDSGYGQLNPAVRTGYKFDGWFTQPNGSGKRITDSTGAAVSAENKVTADITLYASWTANEIGIVYNKNGGTGSLSAKTVTYDSTYGNLATGLTKKGYVFDGWTLTNGGTDFVISSTKVTATGDSVNLYAHWTEKTYTVTLVDPRGIASKKSLTVSFGGKFDGLEDELTDSGYIFDGWFADAAGTGTNVTSATTVGDLAADYTLYAKWTAADVTITFDAKIPTGTTGSAAPASQSYHSGDVYKDLPTVTAVGYNFAGWWTASTGGVEIHNGQPVSATIVLYARWTVKTYTVTLVDSHNKATATSLSLTFGDTFTGLNRLTDTGYTFIGWYDNAAGTGTAVTSSTKVGDLAAGYTLYAHWTANTVTVTFDKKGGVGDADNMQVDYGSTYGALPNVTKTGYTFDGWTITDGGTDFVVPSTKVTESGDSVTLYAKFTIKTYTITLVDSHGKAMKKSLDLTFGEQFDGLEDVLTDTGYAFNGWYDNVAGEGAAVTSSTTVTDLAAGYTLYANWTANTVTVTFDTNDGVGTAESKVVSYGSTYGELPSGLTKVGFAFDGWTLTDNGNDYVTSTTLVTTTDSSVMLFAKWTPVSVKVTFDANGGLILGGSSFTVTLDYNSTTAIASLVPTREGYTFSHWSAGSETVTTATAFTADTTVLANWTANKVTVKFDTNGGDGTVANAEVDYGSAYGELPNVTRTGYTFVGWYTEAENGDNVTSSTTVDRTDEHTLYAHWTVKTYTVTLVDTHNKATKTSLNLTFGGKFTGLEAGLTDAGYTFDGWYDNAEGTGTAVTAETAVGDLADGYTLYAHWTSDPASEEPPAGEENV